MKNIYTDNTKEMYEFLSEKGFIPTEKGFSKQYKYILVLPTVEINQVEYYKNSTDYYIKDVYSEYKYIKPDEYKRTINGI